MYNEIINIVNRAVGVVSLDVVIFIGFGIAGLALILGLGRVVFKKRLLPHCRYKTPFVVVLAWLYLIFAFFVIATTEFTGALPPLSEFAVNMAFPIAVVFLVYVIVWFFNWTVRCKNYCVEYEVKKEPKWAKAERKDSAVVVVGSQEANEEENIKEQKEVKNKKDKDSKEDKNIEKEQENSAVTVKTEITEREGVLQEIEETRDVKEAGQEEIKQEEAKPARQETVTIPASSAGEVNAASMSVPKVEPILSEQPVNTPYSDIVDTKNSAKIDRISRLEEEIERQRQKNVQITDGVRTNTFSGVATQNTYSGEPKVVVRTITEQVQTAPATPSTPNTGFTATRILERTERISNQTGTALGVNNTTTTTVSSNPYLSSLPRPSLSSGTVGSAYPAPQYGSSSSSSSGSISYDSLRAAGHTSLGSVSSASGVTKRSTQDILSSLAELRKSMGNK